MKEIYCIKEYETNGAKKSAWIRIGSGFENSDGSFNLYFDTFPVNPNIKTIQMRDPRPKQAPSPQAPKPGSVVNKHGLTADDLKPDEDVPF